MKKGFLITNGLGLFSATVAISWVIFELITFGVLHPKTRALAPLTSTDEALANFVSYGLIVFLVAHIFVFIANAAQIRHFRKAGVLWILAFIGGIGSCIMLLGDWACIHDIAHEYAKRGQAELEWRVLYRIAAIRGAVLLVIIASLVAAFIRARKIGTGEKALKDEVVFTDPRITSSSTTRPGNSKK